MGRDHLNIWCSWCIKNTIELLLAVLECSCLGIVVRVRFVAWFNSHTIADFADLAALHG